jgi:hypothetical protein
MLAAWKNRQGDTAKIIPECTFHQVHAWRLLAIEEHSAGQAANFA